MAIHTAIKLVLCLFALNAAVIADTVSDKVDPTVIPNVSSPPTTVPTPPPLAISVAPAQSSAPPVANSVAPVAQSSIPPAAQTVAPVQSSVATEGTKPTVKVPDVLSPSITAKTTKIAPILLPSVTKNIVTTAKPKTTQRFFSYKPVIYKPVYQPYVRPTYLTSNSSQYHVETCTALAIFKSGQKCKPSHPKIIESNWAHSKMCLSQYIKTRNECFASRNHYLDVKNDCVKWYAANIFNINLNATEPERVKHLKCLVDDLQNVQIPSCYSSCKATDPTADEQKDFKICSDAAEKSFFGCNFI